MCKRIMYAKIIMAFKQYNTNIFLIIDFREILRSLFSYDVMADVNIDF